METAHKQQSEPQRRVYGRPFAAGVSANPHGRALTRMRADELYNTMVVDFGNLTNVDEVLLRQACRLLARAERLKDVDASIRMSSEARRLLSSLRKRDRKRESEQPSLAQHLAKHYGAVPEVTDALEPPPGSERAASSREAMGEAPDGRGEAAE